ncbi:hypothetical protein [Polyangium spumosum]|uniref:Uncharacterized protein n=1 Tax=Polyangium spumosum TaxID=889282 RepID=A0A6N7PGW0_9BACT|nr:hypothetical protein [Polyangium spumosum]MRG91293.1 hypothetical protein [Polyangium spumosum]
MSVSQSRALAGGIALYLAAFVVLSIALVRLFSASLGAHFELVWLALLPLGLGLGALLGAGVRGIGKAPRSIAPVAHLAALSAGAVAVSVVVGVRARSVDTFDRAALGQLAIYLGTSLLPFLLGGVTITGVLGVARRRVADVGKSGLLGAACGVVVAAFVLRFGPARVGLGAAIAVSLAAALFAIAGRHELGEAGGAGSPSEAEPPRVHLGIIATFVLGCSVLLAGEIGAPYLKLAAIRWIQIERVAFQRWTNRGLLTVDKPSAGAAWLRTDGTFGTPIYEAKQLPPASPGELGYVLHKDQGPALVVGSAGGRELRVALRQNVKEIHAVEAEPTVVHEVMRSQSYAFSGELYDKPEIRLVVEGPRSFIRRPPSPYRHVVVAYVDSLAPTPTGAVAATPSPLFTTQAVREMLLTVVPEGTVTLTRPEADADRLVALATRALRETGAEAPAKHLFGCTKDKISTLLVKRTPLRAEEITNLRSYCRRHRFAELLMAEAPKNNVRRLLVEGADPAELTAEQGADLTPTTDDRPFWFSTVAPGHLKKTLLDVRALKEKHRGLLTIAAGLVVTALAAFVALLGALLVSRRALEGATRGSVLRAALALGFSAAGVSLLGAALAPRLALVVGRTDLVALVLPLVLLLALGVGFGVGHRPRDVGARGAAQRWSLALVFVLAPLVMGLEPALGAALGLTLPARLGVAAVILGAVGVGLGALLALGVRIASSLADRALPLAMAVAGSFAAFALFGGALLALQIGYSAAVLCGGISVLLAAAFVPAARHPTRLAEPRPEPLPFDRVTPISERPTVPEIELSYEELPVYAQGLRSDEPSSAPEPPPDTSAHSG